MVTYESVSRMGSRPVNEDCTGVHQKDGRFGFFLADGLGGHGKGEVASRIAVEQAILAFEAGNCDEQTMRDGFEAGESAILARQKAEGAGNGMKTTFTSVFVSENMVRWGHIGDSRIYYFQDRKLVGRTQDHSVPQMLVAAGEIKEKQIRHHPDRNRLLRVMGVEWERPMYQLAEPVSRRGRQAFLLCSDGFWELVNEKEMLSTLKRAGSVHEWLEAMTALVEKHGRGTNMDNYSAIAVWADEQ